MDDPQRNDEAFRRFLRRVWTNDITPLLRDERADQRRNAARVTGRAAAAAGLFVDGLLGLKGKPFGRFMTVVGSSLGALLPDAWDWRWLRESASAEQKKVVAQEVERRTAELPEADALELFGLTPDASFDELRAAWREAAQRWHPDKARSDAERVEFHVRFVTLSAAYERLERAYEGGRLPVQ